MPMTRAQQPVTFNEPIVVISVDEYRALLAEAGHLPTPTLSRQLAAARARFRKGRTISWELLRRDLR